MTNYMNLIEEEKKTIADLEAKLEKHKALLVALEPLVEPSPISSSGSVTSDPTQEETNETKKIPSRIKEETIRLLSFIFSSPQSIEAVQAEIGDGNRKKVLSQLNYWRRVFGFVEKNADGLFTLTESGREFIIKRNPELLKKGGNGDDANAN